VGDEAERRSGAPWLDDTGLVTLPSGARVRGRRLGDPASPADFALVLARGWPMVHRSSRERRHRGRDFGHGVPAWPHRHIRWPDFWIPTDRADALDALHDAHHRARAGERVEVACRGGIGRTGTALAALAILDGLTPGDALTWVRRNYHHRAVETPWQRRWLRNLR
jgi:hypothetical protein